MKYWDLNWITKYNYSFNFVKRKFNLQNTEFHFKNKIDQFTLKDVLIYLKDNPELIRINSHFKPKFSKKGKNTNNIYRYIAVLVFVIF